MFRHHAIYTDIERVHIACYCGRVVSGVAISVGAIIGVLIALVIVAVIGCRRYVPKSF